MLGDAVGVGIAAAVEDAVGTAVVRDAAIGAELVPVGAKAHAASGISASVATVRESGLITRGASQPKVPTRSRRRSLDACDGARDPAMP